MSNKFQIIFKVNPSHLDNLNHVNNATYVHWMDDVARTHWSYLTKNENFSEYIWVVSKHEIDYKGEAFLDDEIIAKTWVGETGGASSIRHIAFYKGDSLIVKSKTKWVLLNAKTSKPMRIGEKILNVLLPSK